MSVVSYLLGFDLGSSSVKASLMDAEKNIVIASATYPKTEMIIDSVKPGWAEQDPEIWWQNLKLATKEILSTTNIDVERIEGIGISYQMHGLVLVDKDQKVLRPSIIWCDSRAVDIGNKAFNDLGTTYCLSNFLNSPGNFTASKLRWVQENEPYIYEKIHKAMLPGEYIAMKLTGEIQTTVSGLSEGIYWNAKEDKLATALLKQYHISEDLLPEIVPVFAHQSSVSKESAMEIGLKPGTKVSYRAGDQPNNAFSLNVLKAGEVGATAGTSGAIYGILESPNYDPQSRVNTFVHVNHTTLEKKYGVLLCVNGTGILNSWLKHNVGNDIYGYEEMNVMAAKAPIGSDGLVFIPFGNGAERILENRNLGAQLLNLDFNRHNVAHLLRAGQEGIVSSLTYGFNIMKSMGMQLNTVKAGYANMFLSPLFREAFSNMTGATVELYNTDGAQGAARGAGVGAGVYSSFEEAFMGLKRIDVIEPDPALKSQYEAVYGKWLEHLDKQL